MTESSEPPRPAGPTLENRLPAEGINSSAEHPLREFAWVVGASLAALVLVVLLLGWASRWLAPHVPFLAELALADRLPEPPEKDTGRAARSAALQALAERVARQMGLPAGMPLQVRSDASELVNAYATLGGRIRVHEGLLRQLRSEDELAALLAHEIAHVQHRHVAANLGQGLSMALLLSLLSSDAGARAVQAMLGQTAGVVMLGYNREQEAQADADALKAVAGLYGHTAGVKALFDRLHDSAEADAAPLTLLRSHPLTDARLQAVQAGSLAAGWATHGPLTPLPAVLVLPAKP
ncbi:MAG TPA: M48 family metallopeptidase [Ideonella sp.]|uniref:M48 family metallopeptidase n=1 Tax=Ideonella sp. TaxID=1929293 RepID=UPI002BD6695B|nr:M48 family metallopeptidase [Ideonella sp.]HSI50279.1 M48 family metallopeptidase [Ideonella sp.]